MSSAWIYANHNTGNICINLIFTKLNVPGKLKLGGRAGCGGIPRKDHSHNPQPNQDTKRHITNCLENGREKSGNRKGMEKLYNVRENSRKIQGILKEMTGNPAERDCA